MNQIFTEEDIERAKLVYDQWAHDSGGQSLHNRLAEIARARMRDLQRMANSEFTMANLLYRIIDDG